MDKNQISDRQSVSGSPRPLAAMTELRQVAIVTRDLYRSIGDMRNAGITRWKTYKFDGETVKERTYMGKPADFVYVIALADMPGYNLELIQPISGLNVFTDFLNAHGEGVHHLLFENAEMSLHQKEGAFSEAGFHCTQSGKWMGLCTFAYYQKDPKSGISFEIVHRPAGWTRPEPHEIFD
jgi:methylmalonyl-CoA/ethylmalonyl-CoA epimerase